jgi:Zn-dependent M28 family amino/carboxypeptidase
VKELPAAPGYFHIVELTPRRGPNLTPFSARNVIGFIEGTDPKLKKEYIALTAHYDHVGVNTQAKESNGKIDSIFNGARDNAIGVTAILNAARYFSQHPPKRSILFIAWTAEEMGLLGSKAFSDNPILSLDKIVYNLNIDNASYNDTSIISLVGLGRTSADANIRRAVGAFGLKLFSDTALAASLFNASDNVNLAVHGIPSPTFSLGFTSFDSEIRKYYHQVTDEVESMNLNYCLKYIRSYILAAENIANDPRQPQWTAGDKYEAAWKKLYKK